MDLLFRLGAEHESVENAKLFFSDTLPNKKNYYFFERFNREDHLKSGDTIYYAFNGYIVAKAIFTGDISKKDNRNIGHKLKNIEIIDSNLKLNNKIVSTMTTYLDEIKMEEVKRVIRKKLVDIYPDDIDDGNIIEGAKKKITVNAYERSSKARQQCIEKYGYNCSVCNFNFEKIYGIIGKNFIHVHHLKSLSEIKEQYEVNPIDDLRPVCPNCHAMLHKRNPAYGIEEVQNFINKKDL